MDPVDILISGASIAGPTAAYWLARAGHRVTVIERADVLRTAGQNIDVRGPGREVLRRMGLEAAVAAQTTGEVGLRFVDENRVLAEFPAGRDDSSGATAEMEVLRGALARTLVDAGDGMVSYRFGESIERLEQRPDGVTAILTGGSVYDCDAVILAEGARSRTRGLVFDGVCLRELGLYTAFGTIARDSSDDDWWSWYNAVGGRTITIRPDNVGTTRVALSFLSDDPGLQELDSDGQRSAVREMFGDVGWKAPRILDALATTDEFYLDYLTQVKAPRWACGRVFLCGDAAWCATPVSGIGTTLALTGAYILAGEISSAPSLMAAATGYEDRMRPLVDRAQKLPPGTPRLAHPRSRAAVAVTRGLLRVAGSRPARGLAGRLSAPQGRADDLPGYPALAS